MGVSPVNHTPSSPNNTAAMFVMQTHQAKKIANQIITPTQESELQEITQRLRVYKKQLQKALEEKNAEARDIYITKIVTLRAEQYALRISIDKQQGIPITDERLNAYMTAYKRDVEAFTSVIYSSVLPT